MLTSQVYNSLHNWLVALTILKNISQWEGLSHILWKIKMFETTNQIINFRRSVVDYSTLSNSQSISHVWALYPHLSHEKYSISLSLSHYPTWSTNLHNELENPPVL